MADLGSLLDQTKQQFPILGNYDIGFKNNIGGGQGYMESWPPNETGTPDQPRPNDFPIGSFGIENYSAKSKPLDVLGDIVSHHLINVDPTVKKTYNDFQSSVQPFQEEMLKNQYAHAQQNENETRSYEDWKSNTGVPAFFRGHPFQQWPADFNQRAYTPQQVQMLDDMMNYLRGSK